MNTELKYRTFDQLLHEVGTDFVIYNNEGLIEPAQLIKIAQKVNYDLGLRIHGTKEVLLDVENRKVKLPDDFYVLNYAYLTATYKVNYKTQPQTKPSSSTQTPNKKCISQTFLDTMNALLNNFAAKVNTNTSPFVSDYTDVPL